MRGVWTKSTTRESRPKALSFTAKHLVLLHRAASLNHREFANCSAPSLARPLGKKNAAPPRAGKHTKTTLAEEVAARQCAAAARASHTSPARCRDAAAPPPRDADAATPKLHRERFNRRLTRQTPQAFHSKEAVAHVLHHVDDSTVATTPTPRAGVPRYSLRSSATTRTTVIRAAGSV